MNIVQAKQIQLEDFLEKLGYRPTRADNKSLWYYSPFRQESTPSFNVNVNKNVWYDHGIGKGGNIIDLTMELYHSEDLHHLLKQIENLSPAIPPQRYQVHSYNTKAESTFNNIEVLPLTNPKLLSYLTSRGINYKIATEYCKEIHYEYNNNRFYAVAFENIYGGYEIRNPYFKGCISPKAISVIKSSGEESCDTCCIFEGFVDFLSYLTLKLQVTDYTIGNRCTDYVILNSVSQVGKALPVLEQYQHIHCYLDNDVAGITATETIVGCYHSRNVVNVSLKYRQFNDLNDLLMRKRKQ